VNVLGLGFDAGVIARLRGRRLRLPGKAAYVVSALQELRNLRRYQITGEMNGRPLRLDAILVAIGLGRYFGGGMMITPGASPLSQHLQVVLGQRLSRLELLGLLPAIFTGKHLDHPCVAGCYTEHIKLAAEPPALVEADGELIGRTPLEVEIFPAALRFAGHPLS
jgi:diacylglycerol kinase (ATP)